MRSSHVGGRLSARAAVCRTDGIAMPGTAVLTICGTRGLGGSKTGGRCARRAVSLRRRRADRDRPLPHAGAIGSPSTGSG